MTHSIIDLKDVISYLSTNYDLEEYNIFLYGHSWGGYTVCSVFNYELDLEINGVINKAGFNDIYSTFNYQIKKNIGFLNLIITPFMYIMEMIYNKKTYNKTGLDRVLNSNANFLFIYSVDDDMVPYNESFKVYYNNLKNNKRVKFLSFTDHHHAIDIDPKHLDEFQLASNKFFGKYNKKYLIIL